MNSAVLDYVNSPTSGLARTSSGHGPSGAHHVEEVKAGPVSLSTQLASARSLEHVLGLAPGGPMG